MRPRRPQSVWSQGEFDVRLEHGLQGLRALADVPLRAVIVVDVLSFSTCVSVGVERGAAIYPYPWDGRGLSAYAAQHQAVVAGARGDLTAKFSLSPESIALASPGDRIVLPSPNGSTLSFEASGHGAVVAGCLRNRAAIGRLVATVGYPVAIIAAGERWPDGSLRPALEDLLGAGAIVSVLDGARSPEAQSAAVTFETLCSDLPGVIRNVSSGRELMQRGYDADVAMASELDASDAVPLLRDGCSIAA